MNTSDEKADVKQQEISELVAITFQKKKRICKFLECKIGMYSLFNLLGISSSLILSVKNRGLGFFT